MAYSGLFFLGDGSNDSDYLDLIIQEGFEVELIPKIVDFLFSKKNLWDVIFLSEVPETSINLNMLRRSLTERKCYWRENYVSCPYVNLPESWDKYLKSLKPRIRTKLRSLTRRLEEDYKVFFDRSESLDDLQLRLESLFELHRRRWQLKKQEGVFSWNAKRKFYEEICLLFLERGWLRFFSLCVDDCYVAHQFCFEYDKRIFLLQEGFDPTWFQRGVGNVLRAYVFRDCIEKKITVYDFLGGVSDHKLSWGGELKKNVRAIAGPKVLKNSLFFQIPDAVERVGGILEDTMPESVLRFAKSIKRIAGI